MKGGEVFAASPNNRKFSIHKNKNRRLIFLLYHPSRYAGAHYENYYGDLLLWNCLATCCKFPQPLKYKSECFFQSSKISMKVI